MKYIAFVGFTLLAVAGLFWAASQNAPTTAARRRDRRLAKEFLTVGKIFA